MTERVNIALSAPAGHLSHGERQAALIRHSYAVPPSPRGRQGERIVTGGNPRRGPHQSADWFAMTAFTGGQFAMVQPFKNLRHSRHSSAE